MTNAKILLLDVETAPAEMYGFQLFNQNHGIDQIKHDSYMLCWCAKWLGQKKIMFDSIYKHKISFMADPRDDKSIAKAIWKLMDEADICVAHYGSKFDFKWLNTVFIKAGLPPVAPYKMVDTKIEASKNFYFLSNKLDFIGRRLGLGHKVHHDGFDLWKRCMAGHEPSWKLMEKYNKQDVKLLEKAYLKMRPYMKQHPNLATYDDTGKRTCSKCGGHRLKSKGIYRAVVHSYQKLICVECGAPNRDYKILTKGKRITYGI